MSSLSQQQDTQHKHELRRKDHELAKLKERLMRVLTDKMGRMEQPGIDMTCLTNRNPTSGPGVGGKTRARWMTETTDQVVY